MPALRCFYRPSFHAVKMFLIGIALAGQQPVHLLALNVEAVADLVQVVEDLVPQKEVDGGDQHGDVTERKVVH